jgi:hypothetical protein
MTVLIETSQTLDRAKGGTLDQQIEDADAGFQGELVHAPHDMICAALLGGGGVLVPGLSSS